MLVFALRLEDDGSPDSQKKYARLPPPVEKNPYVLRFIVTAGTAASRDSWLFTNYPEQGKTFQRNAFRKLKLDRGGMTDATCDLPITRSGVYEYYVEYNDGSSVKRSREVGSIVVDPRLTLPNTADRPQSSDLLVPLDGICILTVIPKWLPTINRWPDFLRSFTNAGYNMLHFAPVCARGESNSPYSIFDQMAISADLFNDSSLSEDSKENELKNALTIARNEYGLLSITDVVWNHTANNSDWLQDHPEAGYNLKNSPHLRIAYEIDEALMIMSDDLESSGISSDIRTEGALQDAMRLFRDTVIPKLKLWEFYVLDVKLAEQEFRASWSNKSSNGSNAGGLDQNVGHLSLRDRSLLFGRHALEGRAPGKRMGKAINAERAVGFMEKMFSEMGWPDSFDGQLAAFMQLVNELNLSFYQECDGDVAAIIDNVTNRSRYLRVEQHGPRLGKVSRNDPIVDTYFTRIPQNERTSKFDRDELMVANNGWIWNADPLMNFAGPESKAYLRREVIAWGDCVKLRYGNGPEDNPWLWKHQTAYTEKMARLFHGFRIDNCHSTPIHVASYLLDAARVVKPDLYVFAELFTGSEEKDIMFVSKLGINSLIREAMNAWDPKELSRLVHRYGGEPVGSFVVPPEHFPLDMLGHSLNSTLYDATKMDESIVVDIRGSTPHALFMDCTHDNETPHQKRTAEDTLPNAALVAMSNCAIGSVKGYDEIVPELLNVVTESRKYRLPEDYEGIMPAKSILLGLHTKMAREGYNEIHVHQERDFISVHRVHPVTHDGYLLIARCAFNKQGEWDVHSPIVLKNQNVHMIEAAGLRVQVQTPGTSALPHVRPETVEDNGLSSPPSPTQLYHSKGIHASDAEAIKRSRALRAQLRDRKTLGSISGLPSFLDFSTDLTNLASTRQEEFTEDGRTGVQTIITMDPVHFQPGSVVLYRTWAAGSGMDIDVPAAMNDDSHANPQTAHGHGNGNGNLSISIPNMTPPRTPTTPDLKGRIRPTKTISATEGDLEQLWRLLGLDRRNFGVEVMQMMGRDVLESAQLAFTSNKNTWPPGLWDAVQPLELPELNIALYRCGEEEKDMIGEGTYNVPGFGDIVYCGFQGFFSAIQPVARDNNLGHPICNNLRAGTWMLDYVVMRLERYGEKYEKLQLLAKWLKERFALTKQLSPSFRPKYFFMIMTIVYHALKFHSVTRTLKDYAGAKFVCPDASKIRSSSMESFGQCLVMASSQFYGMVNSAGLFPVQGYPDQPSTGNRAPSLAAGLPHFAIQYMRCWGRDIFLSLPGLLLVPGHFEAARQHLISFGSTLRHGLIPNLLDEGNKPRYNARDAAWWWMWGVQEYCNSSPEGIAFLGAEVARRFPPLQRYRKGKNYLRVPESAEVAGDEGDVFCEVGDKSRAYAHRNTIGELCHEIMERHARGVRFREWNAGPALDHAMQDAGFDIVVGTKFQDGSGMVFGGNRYNCGTWMDKMGDSEKAGTKGLPATPRDGSAVEIVGLQKAALRWISTVVLKGEGAKMWPATSVVIDDGGNEKKITYEQWNTMLGKTFEKCFYLPQDPREDGKYAIDRPELVNRRGIYKDSMGATQSFADYQLRPNFCVALTVAPEMIDPDHARAALEVVKQHLMGPLGLKTLDPSDWAYRGDYDNANDSADPTVAHGYNYHQGPEWVWVMGYFLRAYLHFNIAAPGADPKKAADVAHWVQKVLLAHKVHIADLRNSPFAGLPELTNKDGAKCWGSCDTQAWSVATILDKKGDGYCLTRKPQDVAFDAEAMDGAVLARPRTLALLPRGGGLAIILEAANSIQATLRFEPGETIELSQYQELTDSYGCVGLVRIGNDVFVGVVTEAHKATERDGVLRIVKTHFFSLLSYEYDDIDALNEQSRTGGVTLSNFTGVVGATVGVVGGEDANQASQMLQHPCGALSKLLSSGTFYFSTSADLTRSTQRRCVDDLAGSSGPDSADRQFIWNGEMLRSIMEMRERDLSGQQRDDLDRSNLLVFLIQGFVGSGELNLGRQRGWMSMVSRLSCKRAGTRFNARGIDDDGYVSNFVETEVMVAIGDELFSFVQIRGSAMIKVPQKIDIPRGPEATAPATRKHFAELRERYQKVRVINLLSRKDGSGEALLSDTFKSQINRMGTNERPAYTPFDFHAVVKGNNYDKASLVLDDVRGDLVDFGCFSAVNGFPQTWQTGVMRTNCLDCLDRTNVIQCILSKYMIQHHFGKAIPVDAESFLNVFNGLWADNGDSLSKIYGISLTPERDFLTEVAAGTGAIKSSLTRKGRQTVLGFLDDAAKSVNRFYINNFQDKGRQEAIDTMLGKTHHKEPILLLNPLNKAVSDELHRRRAEVCNNKFEDKANNSKYSTTSTISVFLGTWNVNGKLPYGETTSQWWTSISQEKPPHLLFLGIQELIELTANQMITADTEKLRAIWEAHLHRSLNLSFPNTYVLLRSTHLVALGIFAFCRNDCVTSVRNLETSIVKTGLGGMAGNKGGIALSLTYNDTPLVFITAHLAAGEKSVEERNRDYWTITRGLVFKRRKLMDHDAILWFGDFNYRVDLPNEDVCFLCTLLIRLIQLLNKLNLSREEGLAFPDFIEGDIDFDPTYKYDNGTTVYDTSEKGRTPSWTDRVLFKGSCVRLLKYGRSECLISDHRPVYAVLNIDVLSTDLAERNAIQKSIYDAKNKFGHSEKERIQIERVQPFKPARPASGALLLNMDIDDPFTLASQANFDSMWSQPLQATPGSASARVFEEDLPKPSTFSERWWNHPVDDAWIPKEGDSTNPFYTF
ncbi:hypothetical protein HK101_006611 [Irineochytrium annulatum]|nr:hypothetical protein HK101_006611 [Irineochytrium annulatum]